MSYSIHQLENMDNLELLTLSEHNPDDKNIQKAIAYKFAELVNNQRDSVPLPHLKYL